MKLHVLTTKFSVSHNKYTTLVNFVVDIDMFYEPTAPHKCRYFSLEILIQVPEKDSPALTK